MDGTDIGSSGHFLVRMELSRAHNTSKKRKHVIIRWRLDRYRDDEVKLSYQNALKSEEDGLSESIKNKVERGIKGQELVNEVVIEWESVVNRVAMCEHGVKKIGCGGENRLLVSRSKTKLTKYGKYITRFLMVKKMCGMSIVD